MITSLRSLTGLLTGKAFQSREWELLQQFQSVKGGHKPFKSLELLKLIREGKEGELEARQKSGSDRKALHRLKESMARLVLLIHPHQIADERLKQLFLGNQELMIGKFLRHLHVPRLAQAYLERAFNRSKQEDLHEVRASSAEYLAVMASLEGDMKGFEAYESHCLDALQKMKTEKSLFLKYQRVITYFATHSEITHSIQVLLEEAIEEALTAYNSEGTAFTLLYSTRLSSIKQELNSAFEEVLALWKNFDEATQNFQCSISAQVMAESHIKKMAACLNLRDYSEGEQFAARAFRDIDEQSWNWFYFNFYYVFLLFHTQRFEQSRETLQKTFNNPQYPQIPDNLKELFLLLNGFMEFVIESKWDQEFSARFSQNQETFRIHKLINQLPTQSKDKHGVNAVLTILQFLFHFNRKEYQALYSLENSLNLYRKRYLQDKPNPRMAIFFDLLIQAIREDFRADALIEATSARHGDLLNTQFRYEGGYEDLEILPFEELWEWVLNKIKCRAGIPLG